MPTESEECEIISSFVALSRLVIIVLMTEKPNKKKDAPTTSSSLLSQQQYNVSEQSKRDDDADHFTIFTIISVSGRDTVLLSELRQRLGIEPDFCYPVPSKRFGREA